jgi:uncharacterized membrane protein YhaH (DUF805 family)
VFDPYSPPQAPLSQPDGEGEPCVPRVFALSGRIGRVRFLAYASAAILLLNLGGTAVGVMLAGIVERSEVWGAVLGFLVSLACLVVTIMLARRRLEDMDQSGWLAGLLLVPVVNLFAALWMLFAPGADGPNSHGPAPSPNTLGVLIVASALPTIAILGGIAVFLVLSRLF